MAAEFVRDGSAVHFADTLRADNFFATKIVDVVGINSTDENDDGDYAAVYRVYQLEFSGGTCALLGDDERRADISTNLGL